MSKTRKEIKKFLQNFILSDDLGLKIFVLCGPGGIGKTFLLNEVCNDINLIEKGIVNLSISGVNHSGVMNFAKLVEYGFCPQQMQRPAKHNKDYFKHARSVFKIYHSIFGKIKEEIEENKTEESIKNTIKLVIEIGLALSEFSSNRSIFKNDLIKAGKIVTEQNIDTALSLIRGMNCMAQSWWPWERDANKVKKDFFGFLSDELILDWQSMLYGFEVSDSKQYLRFTTTTVNGYHKLLLIVDDFETTGIVLKDFLLGSLLPRLKNRPFPIKLVILGRDDLEATDTRFRQHFEPEIIAEERLEVFTHDEAVQLLNNAGYTKTKVEEILDKTGCYPYLISFYLDNKREDINSALSLKKFYDRTTKWMTKEQINWFNEIVFLSEVNLNTLMKLFPQIDEKTRKVIMSWFVNEASVRDPKSEKFCVNPLIKDRVINYFSILNGENWIIEKQKIST